MGYNWNKAPSWAQYAATCAFSGNREWFRSEPRSPGWVDVEARPGDGDANESEWSTTTPEGYRQPVRWPKSGAAIAHGEYGVKWMGLLTEHSAPVRILASLPELKAWLEENPAMTARVIPSVLDSDGNYVSATDHAAELAEAAQNVIDAFYHDGAVLGAVQCLDVALVEYKQSRGE